MLGKFAIDAPQMTPHSLADSKLAFYLRPTYYGIFGRMSGCKDNGGRIHEKQANCYRIRREDEILSGQSLASSCSICHVCWRLQSQVGLLLD